MLDSFPRVYADMEKLLFRNRIFLDRVRGVGVLSKADAIAHSCSGPIARASGVTYDLRKDEPYLVYPELDFEVPYSEEGDCWARFIVRMEEMRQSHRLIQQAVERLPSGPVNVPIAEKFPLPDKLTTYNSMEGLIQHFELIMPNRGFETPARRGLRGRRGPQRRARLLPRRRRQPGGLARPDPAAVVHPFFRVPPDDQGSSAGGRRGRAGEPQYHRGGIRPLI